MCKQIQVMKCGDCGDLIPLVDDENMCENCGLTVDKSGREVVIPHLSTCRERVIPQQGYTN